MLSRTHHSASGTAAAPCDVSIFIIIDQIAGGYRYMYLAGETSCQGCLDRYSHVGAGCSCRYATKYQVTYKIVGYIPTSPCVERVDRQVRRYAWCRQRSYLPANEIVGTLNQHVEALARNCCPPQPPVAESSPPGTSSREVLCHSNFAAREKI